MAKTPRKKANWQEYFKKDNLGKRLLVAFFLLISLALVIHFREVQVEILDIGTSARHYVVAQVDFEYEDQEGSRISKGGASNDIGLIYQIGTKDLEAKYAQFKYSAFHEQRWRHTLPNETFDDVHAGAEVVKSALLKVRFTDKRTLEKLKKSHMIPSGFYLLPTNFNGKKVTFPKSFWASLKKGILDNKVYRENIIDHIIDNYFIGEWTLDRDSSIQRKLKREVAEKTPGKTILHHAGDRIIDQGEIVSEEHLIKLQAMKEALKEKRKLWEPFTFFGALVFSGIFIVIGAVYFSINHKRFIESTRKLALYATIIILTLILTKLTEYFLIENTQGLIETIRYPLFIPFAVILICILFNAEIAFFSACILSVILGFSLAVNPERFIVINIITGVVSIFSARFVRRRKEIFAVCAKAWLTCIPVFFIFLLTEDVFWNASVVGDLTTTFAFLLITSILVVGLLPIFESIFDVMTDITLVEYMDPNNELLKRLSSEAPGTYQHSLVVGTIAEAAASAIGANGLFCRVSTLYHDIGKLFNPHYFTENQMGGFNIHQLLTPLESTQVIISHVTEGEVLARKNSLPQNFINIIREHHGTSRVYYFYCKQVEQMGGDVDAVDESQFRYPGPTPRSKESAIIMMADIVEAASRSLEVVNEESILDLVNRLIHEKVEDGQFDNCDLTFQEFEIVKGSIAKTLFMILHIRLNTHKQKLPEQGNITE